MNISCIDFYKLYQSSLMLKIIDVKDKNGFDKYYYIICKDRGISKEIVKKLNSLGYHLTCVIGSIKYW